ncbi:MAG: hypothetical protein CM1200mP20_16430 [Pseudomonadota bacterium]|nr:MAG: hypothetical protein CM1200mP20_16430 [Pseudomonadota bacterium]
MSPVRFCGFPPGERVFAPKTSVQRTKRAEQDTWLGIGVLDQDIEFSVQVTSRDGNQVYRINVEANETLGHYSDWLKLLGVLGPIRRLNGNQETRTLEIGDALLLPITGQTQRSEFEQRRQEYHRVLVEEFKEHFEIVEVRRYTVRGGDSVWRLARDFDLPLWMITRYNPKLRTAMPVIGDELGYSLDPQARQLRSRMVSPVVTLVRSS